jgi:hypothetical protein
MKPRLRMTVSMMVFTGNSIIKHEVDVAENSHNQPDSEIFMAGARELTHRLNEMLKALEADT